MRKYLIPIIFVVLNLFLVYKLVTISHDIQEINKERNMKIVHLRDSCSSFYCSKNAFTATLELYNGDAKLHKGDIYKKEAVPLFLLVVVDLFLSTFFIKRTHKNVSFVMRMISIVAVVGLALLFLLFKVLPNFL